MLAIGVGIESAEAERKPRRVSRLFGKSMTATVLELADAKLKGLDAQKDRERRLRRVDESVQRIKRLPVLSTATEDEFLGYNEHGLFD